MRTTRGFAFAVALSITVGGTGVSTGSMPVPETVSKALAEPGSGALPVVFEANQGQADRHFDFVARARGYTALIGAQETAFLLPEGSRRRVLRMRIEGASETASARGVGALESRSHYLLGNDPQAWHRDVPHYRQVTAAAVRPGATLRWRPGTSRRLRYDVEIAARGSPASVTLAFTGARSLRIAAGDLIVETEGGTLRHSAPVAYQQVDGTRRPVAARFVLRGRSAAGFALGAYDTDRPVVIDPTITYLTYLGGTGGDLPEEIAVDASGAAYVGGWTGSSDLPTQVPVQGTLGGSVSGFITKLAPGGTSLVYSTYLGGGSIDRVYGIAVDASGSAVVAGYTQSDDFPVANAVQATLAGASNGFVTKLAPDGASLSFSTYYGDQIGEFRDVALDSAGAIYVCGRTFSANFPTVNPIQATFLGGFYDAVACKFASDGSTVAYATFLGGSENDYGYGIAVDSAGGAYVTGQTFSDDFPTTAGVFQPAENLTDVFVTKINAAGTAFAYSTYLGGSSADCGEAVAVDATGRACVVGDTRSTDFPSAGTAYTSPVGIRNAFAAKLSAAGDALVSARYLGRPGNESHGENVALGPNGLCHVVWTLGTRSDLESPLISDVLVDALDDTGASVDSVTFGGGASNSADGIDVAPDGRRFVTGQTNWSDLGTTDGVVQPTFGGNADAFVAEIGPVAGPSVGDGLLYVGRAVFTVNHAKHARDKPSDGVTLRGCLNPAGALADLSGAAATVTIDDTPILAALALDRRGAGRSDKGVRPSARFSFKQKNGKFALSLRKADLRGALGFDDEDARTTVDLDVAVTIAGAGLVTESVRGTLRCDLRSKAGKTARARFKAGSNACLDGVFKCTRTTGSERSGGEHRLALRAALAAPAGESLLPVGSVTLTIGNAQPIVVPLASLDVAGARVSYRRSLGEVAGLQRFKLDGARKQLSLSTADLAGVGLPVAGDAAETSHSLPVRVEFDLASGGVRFETTVELLRASGTSRRWAR